MKTIKIILWRLYVVATITSLFPFVAGFFVLKGALSETWKGCVGAVETAAELWDDKGVMFDEND